MTQLLLALQYIHGKGIVHRDIKPSNILSTKAGLLKLSDFGISTVLEGDKLAQTSVGTPYYLAPEMVSATPYGHPADIWMLGCTLYEACTLTRPFSASNLQEILLKICNQSFDETPLEGYSSFLRKTIAAMLQKDPKERPTVASLLEFKEIREEIQSLVREYPDAYKAILGHTLKSRKRDLELDINEPTDGHIVSKSIQKSRYKQTSSTKNKDSENSIFKVIERAKAKSNGTTPQHASNLTPSNISETTPQSKKAGSIPKLCDQGEGLNLVSSSIRPKDFVSPKSLEMASPNTVQFLQKKKRGFSFINSVFGKQNPQSPARVPLAKKFIEEKIGLELFLKIDKLSMQDPRNFVVGVKEVLGSEHRNLLPIIEYVYIENKSGVKMNHSPISVNTESTNTNTLEQQEKDQLLMTFAGDYQK